MGWELAFKYHPGKEEGPGYDTEKVETFNKKVGNKSDDVPESEVLKVIVTQMARRDIWITDVEVHEYTRRKVPFKFLKGGFSFKGKKFGFDEVGRIDESGYEHEEKDPPLHQSQPRFANQQTVQGTQAQPRPQQQRQGGDIPSTVGMSPIRMETFDPDPRQQQSLRHVQLTVGKKYAIFVEEPGNQIQTPKYIIRDDAGRDIRIGSEYFVAGGQGLLGGDFSRNRTGDNEVIKLSYDGGYVEDGGGVVPLLGMEGLDAYGNQVTQPDLDMMVPDVRAVRQKLSSQGRANAGMPPRGRMAPPSGGRF